MTLIKKHILVLLLFTITLQGWSQQYIIDSLKTKLENTDDKTEQYKVKSSLSHYYIGTDFDSTKYYAQEVINGGKELNDNRLVYNGYCQLSKVYIIYGYDSTFYQPYIDSAEIISIDNNFIDGLAFTSIIKGNIAKDKNHYQKAVNYYLKSKEYYHQIENTEGEAIIINNLVELYTTSGNYKKAIDFINENDSILQKAKDKQLIVADYIQFFKGIAFNYMTEYDSALVYILKTYKNIIYNQYSTVDAYQHIGYAYYFSGAKDSAEIYFRKIVNESKINNDSIIALSYLMYCDCLIDQEKYNNAKTYLLASLQCYQESTNYLFQLKTLRKLSDLSALIGDKETSLEYLQKYIAMKDSCFEYEQLDFVVDNIITEKELEHLKTELNDLSNTNLSSKKHILLLSAFILLICFFGIWVMQTGLSNVMPAVQEKPTSNRWQYNPPKIFPTRKLKNILALLHMLITYVLLAYYYTPIHNMLIYIGFAIVSGISLLLSINSFYKYLSLKESLSILQEIKLTFLFAITSFVILGFVLIATQFLFFITINYTIAFIINANAIFLCLSFHASILYRLRFEKQIRQFITMFNFKLEEQKKKHPETIDPIINIDSAGKTQKINLNDVVYVLSENVYQEFICIRNGEITKTLIRNTLSTIEKQLAEYQNFVRCHRSYIVNLDRVIEVQGNSKQQYFVTDGTKDKIPISRTQTQKILSHFEAFSKN